MPYIAASGYAYAGIFGAFSWSVYSMPISASEREILNLQSYLARRIDMAKAHVTACSIREGRHLGFRYGSASDTARARRARDALYVLWDESETLLKNAQMNPDADGMPR